MSERYSVLSVNKKMIRWVLGASCVYFVGPGVLIAEEDIIEEIVVTGSYLKHLPEDSPTPIQVLDRMDLESSGVPQIADIMGNLTANSGSEFRSNLTISNGMAGSANINLRGLGLGSTLVLLNGKRLTLSSIVSNDGSSFVDINQLPVNMIEAIEIQKDGAAATYGTDAVAGVVNFKLRSDFEGFEFRAGNQSTVNDLQMDNDISMLWGAGNGTTHGVVSVLTYDRTPLDVVDRDYAVTDNTVSTLGAPGALLISGVPYIDPGCEAAGGIANTFNPSGTIGTCGFQFGTFFELVAPETRTNIYGILTHEFDNLTEFQGEISYYKNKVDGLKASPSFPMLSFPVIPADNPGNFRGEAGGYLGRVVGPNGSASRLDYQTESSRIVLDFKNETGEFAGWNWNAGVTYGNYRRVSNTTDTLTNSFERAVNGVGGDDCQEEIGSALRGQGDCSYFVIGGGSDVNSLGIYDYLAADLQEKSFTSSMVFDNVYTREIDQIELPGGTVEMAVGWQYRKDEFRVTPNDTLRNADETVYFVGSIADMNENQDVYAFFSEFALPLFDRLEAQFAFRFEEYGGKVGSSLDPKLAVRWDVADFLVARGSVSSTFKAPTLSQRFSRRTALESIISDSGGRLFVGVQTAGTETLVPEEAVTMNLGTLFNFADVHSISLDYWRIDFENVIVKENAQQVANEYYADNDVNTDQLTITEGVGIVGVSVNYVNAGEINTDGIDMAWTWDFEAYDLGGFRSKLVATYINSYDLVDHNGVEIDALNNFNKTNSARPVQDKKFNWGLDWSRGQHTGNLTWHHIGSYQSDVGDLDTISSQNTFDVQYSYTFVQVDATLTGGIANLTDEAPPTVETEFGFDSLTHDPRGMMAYLRGRINF
ncbi:MAG: hypothetical protein COB04_10945 [Gammaproteobacteria bacterium]|nr:MAG: hypothetical protein COB04_10945 [Gammaproteobacteria bacterium]